LPSSGISISTGAKNRFFKKDDAAGKPFMLLKGLISFIRWPRSMIEGKIDLNDALNSSTVGGKGLRNLECMNAKSAPGK